MENCQVLPEYLLHLFFNLLFLFSGEWLTLALNLPLIGYHVHRLLTKKCRAYCKASISNLNPLRALMQSSGLLTVCHSHKWKITGFLFPKVFIVKLSAFTHLSSFENGKFTFMHFLNFGS